MDFKELLSRLNDSENPVEDMPGFISELEKAHDNALSIRDAKVKSVQEEYDTLNKQHDKLKITNYDLMMSRPADKQDDGDDPDPDPKPGDQGIDSLFDDPTN